MNNSIFGSGREKILSCFYRNMNKELYFSEILRETGLTQNTTLRHLQFLQGTGLISSRKMTANTFYKIEAGNPQIFSIFSYFDYDRFNSLPTERKRAITMFLQSAEPKPIIAIVFGSTAKDSYGPESDIDLLLVFAENKAKRKKIEDEIEAITGISIQAFEITYDHFKEQVLKRSDNLIMHAIKTGFVMTGHYHFYKEIIK